MKVLFVSFHFPPFNAIAGLRASKLARELVARGHAVKVITAVRDDLPADLPLEIPEADVVRTRYVDVNALPKLVLGRRRISRRGYEFGGSASPLARAGELYRQVVNFPDGQIGWRRPAIRAGRALMSAWRPDVILSVASPWTSHLVSGTLSRDTGVPWVAEYQDLWTESRSRWRPRPLLDVERWLESRTTRDAAAILTVSDAWAERLAEQFPRALVRSVPLGFDPDDYDPAVTPAAWPFTIAYTGRVYERQHPEPFFRALGALVARGTLRPDELRVRFVGRYLDVARQALASSGIDPTLVEIGDPLPHAEALRLQQCAHVLPLFLGDDDDVGWRPAKLYEYLGARRPILVMGGTPGHEAREIVLGARAGLEADGVEAIAARLSDLVTELRATGHVAYRGDVATTERYTWASLGGELEALLADAVGSTRS